MSEDAKPRSWWYTLPGVFTGLAGIVTATAGLIVALKQTGWFERQSRPPVTAPAPSSPTPTGTALPGPAEPVRQTSPVNLPALRDYKLGEATFTLLQANLSPQTTEKDALQIRARMMNHSQYPANFWGSSFRLIVDGVPMAPESGLNEVVPSQSAKEGEVTFVIPHETAGAILRIIYADGSTEIPLGLGMDTASRRDSPHF
jgi:hypothetical protein